MPEIIFTECIYTRKLVSYSAASREPGIKSGRCIYNRCHARVVYMHPQFLPGVYICSELYSLPMHPEFYSVSVHTPESKTIAVSAHRGNSRRYRQRMYTWNSRSYTWRHTSDTVSSQRTQRLSQYGHPISVSRGRSQIQRECWKIKSKAVSARNLEPARIEPVQIYPEFQST